MRNLIIALGFVLILVALTGCSSEPKTGPGEVRWDKVSCERCIMSVSDRHFAAQVRGGEAERKTKLYFFDDLGCAVLWLEKQTWQNDPRTEMWVADHNSGEWLNAWQSSYVTGQITPMDFGLGAEPEGGEATLSYEQAVQEIQVREKRHR